MEVLTHSKRQAFRACRRAYYYRFEQRLVPRIERSVKRRGTAFGLILQKLAEAEMAEQVDIQPSPDTVVDLALGDYYHDQNPNSQEEADELEFEMAALYALALRYVEIYGLAGRREISYERALVNPKTGRASRSFLLGGKIDGIRVIGPERALVIEDKLVSQITKTTIENLPLDEQTSEYVDALLWRGWSGEAEFRWTRWPSIKRKKDENLAQFVERFIADLHEREDFYFVKESLLFPTDQLDDFRRERWQIAKDILECRRSGRWYKNPTRCDIYRGGCQYSPLCLNRPGAMDLYRVAEVDNEELNTAQEVAHG